MRKVATRTFTQLFILLLALIMTGCGQYIIKNKKADDDISKAISEAIGEKVYYEGREINKSDGAIVYKYLIRDYDDEGLLEDIVEVVNKEIKEESSSPKIYLQFFVEISGGMEQAAGIYNYYEDSQGFTQYETLQSLNIYGTKNTFLGDSNPYNEASTYINLPDIKNLTVTEDISQNAEDEGIDWYEIWKDLEYYEIFQF